MSKDDLRPGTLVRHNETTARWYLATVRSTHETTVSIEYIDGITAEVGRYQVEPFTSLLRDRTRAFSRDRDDLCRILYRRPFERLTSSRIEEMQAFLRKHGLRYSPAEWPPDARIRIDPDGSILAPTAKKIDKDLDALLPRWLEPHKLPPGSRDPLGFQSHAERIANEILPGLTVFTSRIGYYGFITWAVDRLNREKLPRSLSRREAFERLERTLALCEFIHHGAEDRSCPLLGQRSRSQILQSAVNDEFTVPRRILKNQTSAGAFRLYSTSLESMGFAESAPELRVDGLMPLRLTPRGKALGDEMSKCVPDGFFDFALSEKKKERDTLRAWGKRLCFSDQGKGGYRKLFLEGFLLGGTRAAETRHHTVRTLFDRGLLTEDYGPSGSRPGRSDLVGEDDAGNLEDESEEVGIENRGPLLRFFLERPSGDNLSLQKAAVFELLSLALTALFALAIRALETAGTTLVSGLTDAVLASGDFGKLWKRPFGTIAAKAGTVPELEQRLLKAEDPAEAAAIAGALIARVQASPAFVERAPDLADTPVMELLHCLDPNKPLASTHADLLAHMVMRHEQVSRNKNRQRWCYVEGASLVRDDPRPLAYGWHSMRFPQLWSLCRDLHLTNEDVADEP